jgi:osmotically-inducible protein OsmY
VVTQERNFHGLPPQSDVETPNGAEVEHKAADALARAGNISPSDIVVVDVDGSIYLRGAVSSEAEVEAAGEIARSVDGVKAVINEIEVVSGQG